MVSQKKFWMIKTINPKEAQINIDGEIVSQKWDDADTSAASFRNDLNNLGDVDVINMHINSPGGSVFEGISIYNQLRQNKATVNVYVDGLAASIASVIAMSGDTIFMPENSMLMIHNPWTMAVGNAKELRKQADDLDHISESSVTTYLGKSNGKLDEDKLRQLLDEETWLTAQESVDYGLADEIIPANQMAASISKNFENVYKNIPSNLLKQKNSESKSDFRKTVAEKAAQKSKEISNYLGGLY